MLKHRISLEKVLPFPLLLVTSVLVLLVMIYFGFRLKGFKLDNHVQWIEDGPGIIFNPSSIAYTEGFFPSVGSDSRNGISLEFAIAPKSINTYSFKNLILIHAGTDKNQLIVGQWRSSLVVMNGDDYSNKRKTPKLYFKLEEKIDEPQLITIVSNSKGTSVYINGQLRRTKKSLILRFPSVEKQGRLVIGNSLQLNHPWDGKLFGLTVYDYALSDVMIKRHQNAWHMGADFKAFGSDSPQALFAFDHGNGNKAYNHGRSGFELLIPARVKKLDVQLLTWPNVKTTRLDAFLKDVFVNLFGFLPLAFILFATLDRLKWTRYKYLWGGVICFCFSFSFLIETIQAWIPSRNSSMLDLVLNTIGSALGVMIYSMLKRHSEPERGTL